MPDQAHAPGLPDRVRERMQAHLDQSHELLARTMKEWGVTPHDLEGRFVEALRGTHMATAEVVLAAAVEMAKASEGFDRHAQALTAKAEAEIIRLKHATAKTELLNKDYESKTFEQLVTKLSGKIQEKLEAVMVLRAHRWDQVTYWRASGLVAAVGLGLLIGGYRWKAAVDHDANLLLESCQLSLTTSPDGSMWCLWKEPPK